MRARRNRDGWASQLSARLATLIFGGPGRRAEIAMAWKAGRPLGRQGQLQGQPDQPDRMQTGPPGWVRRFLADWADRQFFCCFFLRIHVCFSNNIEDIAMYD